MNRTQKIRAVADGGLMLALATILSIVTIFKMPFGGGVTLFSMLPIGIYAYRTDILLKLIELRQSGLEISESLEQLRWLENGYEIRVAETDHENIAIDTPEDLLKLKNI